MAVLGVDDFKAKLTGGGARPNLFRVRMTFPAAAGVGGTDAEAISFMVKAAQMPASTITPIVVPFRGRQLKIAGDRTFEAWTVTVLNTTDFKARNAFERWMDSINQHENNTGLTNISDYEAQMYVDQLDKDGSVLKTYEMRGVWPSSLGAIEVSWETESQIEEFQVTLEVQYWVSDTTN